jgi:hypothetical protein
MCMSSWQTFLVQRSLRIDSRYRYPSIVTIYWVTHSTSENEWFPWIRVQHSWDFFDSPCLVPVRKPKILSFGTFRINQSCMFPEFRYFLSIGTLLSSHKSSLSGHSESVMDIPEFRLSVFINHLFYSSLDIKAKPIPVGLGCFWRFSDVFWRTKTGRNKKHARTKAGNENKISPPSWTFTLVRSSTVLMF